MEGEFVVLLEGGSPWGFALQGGVDHRSPLRIGKVTLGGRAMTKGLVAGDYILTINGTSTKDLKHLQAQQLIKTSKLSVELHCTKVRPGVTSPAVSVQPPTTFSFSANKSPPRARSLSVSKPLPPSQSGRVANGHVRGGSLDTPSDSTTFSTPSSSPSHLGHTPCNVDPDPCSEDSAPYSEDPTPCSEDPTPCSEDPTPCSEDHAPCNEDPASCNLKIYDIKFVGIHCLDCSANDTTPLPVISNDHSDNLHSTTEDSPVDSAVTGLEEELVDENDHADSAVAGLEEELVDEDDHADSAVAGLEEELVDEDDPADSAVTGLEEELVDMDGMIGNIQQQVQQLQETAHQEVNGQDSSDVSLPGGVANDVSDVANDVSVPGGVANDVSIPGGVANDVSVPGGVANDVSVPGGVALREEGTITSGTAGSGRRQNSFSMRELVDVISHAAQERTRRDSSVDLSSSCDSHPPPPTLEVTTPPRATTYPPPPTLKEDTPPANVEPVIKPSLTKKDDCSSMLHKDPGWYQQMFQTFTNQVDQTFPTASKSASMESPAYVYDERGLKVKKDEVHEVKQEEEPEMKQKTKSPEPEDPVYVYDERGLRVPRRAGHHVRGASTPAVMEGGAKDVPLTQGIASVGSSSKEDILALSKKSTSYKANQYSTSNTRDYWKQKDQYHVEFDVKRRKSQEQIFQRRHSSSSELSDKMSSLHPLLLADTQTEQDESANGKSENGQSVFERIDASKLQGALKNASVLTSLEQEGVPSHLLPALAQQQAADEAKADEKKTLKPAPQPKAQAKFAFQGKKDKELSFKKGDFIDLTHTVDENWLEGEFGGKVGIFPANYVKVLTMAEYKELTAPQPQSPIMKAQALYDYQGQTQRELEFLKDDVLTVEKQVDENWYSGNLGDKKGIFPVAYVKIIEQ